MDRELVKKWFAAARSGDYQQCKHALHNTKGRYCYLGIAVELIHGKDIWCKPPNDSTSFRYGYVSPGDWKFHGTLPNCEDAELLGLLDGNVSCTDILEMNDRQNLSFNEITDILEKKLLGESQ